MKLNQLNVYFIQETWLEGDVFDEVINGYHIFRHNGELSNHNFRGVAIILSPKYHKGWKAAGAQPPITIDATGEFAGRFISTNIKLASNDRVGKQVRGVGVYTVMVCRWTDHILARNPLLEVEADLS